MKKIFVVAVALFLFIASAFAHDGVSRQDKGPFTLKKLTDDIYVLYGRGGNIGICATPEGVVVIDDQFADLAPGIAAQIKTISDKPVKFLINTHHHFDHTGGNEFFIKMTTIVAHDNVRKHMLAAPQETIENQTARIQRLEKQLREAKDPQSKEVADLKGQIEAAKKNVEAARAIKISDVPAPNITFSREMRIYVGGKEIQVFHAKRGHTDGDSIIYFPKDKVAHLGDLFVNRRMPFIDRAHGASSAEWVETLDAVLSRIDPASQVIPGHGEAGTVADLRVFRQYLVDLREAVRQAIAEGKTREQAVKEIQLPQYASHTGYAQGLAGNVGIVYDEMKEGK
jgi:glyoxylase-like metal-dependent hydrolase (beta-lactamase superfamily II)